MTLPALATLAALRAAYDVRRFDPALDAAAVAAALGLPPGAVLKTLAVASMQGVTLCCLGADRDLDLAALGDGRLALVAEPALQRMTGFAPGAATPIPPAEGRRFPVVLDAAALAHPLVAVGAGEAGVAVQLAPQDLARAAAAEVRAISHG